MVHAQRVLDRDLEALGARRLDHEVDGARAHRVDHGVDRAVRGLDDHRGVEAALAHLGEHAEPVEARHHEVEEHHVGPLGAQERKAVRAVLGHLRREAESPHRGLGEAALDRIVVHDEDGGGHGGSGRGRAGPGGGAPPTADRAGGCFVSNRTVTQMRKVALNDVFGVRPFQTVRARPLKATAPRAICEGMHRPTERDSR